MSRPLGRSVNDAIHYVGYRWVRIHDAAERMYPGCTFIRLDIKDYYRTFAVDPADWHLLAFRGPLDAAARTLTEIWDTRLPFGVRHAVEFAHRCSTFITWLLQHLGLRNIFTIMDDILIISTPQPQSWLHPSSYFTTARKALEHLGFTVHTGNTKTHDWAPSCEWLGLVLDGHLGRIYLPERKLTRYAARIDDAITLAQANKALLSSELIALVATLVYCSQVVWGGSTHLRALLLASSAADASPNTTWRLNRAALAELMWWRDHLRQHNGYAITPGHTTPEVWISSDARGCGDIGTFATPTDYNMLKHAEISTRWADAPPTDADVTVHESFAILTAIRLHLPHITGKRVGLIVDNPKAAKMARKLRHRDPLIHPYAITIYNLATAHGFRITEVRHVPGTANQLADACSRFDTNRLASLLAIWPHSQLTPVVPY